MYYKIFFLLYFFIILSDNVFASQKILGLYKSTDNATDTNNAVLNHLGEPLKKLGYDVDYRDVLKELPSSEMMKQYDGIVTFFFNPLYPDPTKYISWLSGQIKEGRKVIIVGNFGAYSSDGKTWLTGEELNDFFFNFGLSVKGIQTVDPSDVEISYKDSKMFPSLPVTFPDNLVNLVSFNKHNKDYLRLTLKADHNIQASVAVRTPFGAIAQTGYIYSSDDKGNVIWHLNRLAFLDDVLSYKTDEKISSHILLALYKSTEGDSRENNLIRTFASEPLFKLGYEVEYRDIDRGIPDEADMDKYYGIISWYRGPVMSEASLYCDWLSEEMAKGKKIIILGNFGAYTEKIEEGIVHTDRFISEWEYNNFFYPFGLRMDKFWTDDPNLIVCDYMDKKMVNTANFNNYFRFKSVNPRNKPYLTLLRKDIPDSQSSVVVVTPYGAMALEGYIYSQESSTWKINHILNLEHFFDEALKKTDFVPPETFTFHVDTKKELDRAGENSITLNMADVCDKPLLRRVLVLFKGSEDRIYLNSPFYTYTGAIVTYLGLVPDYLDIEQEKPDDRTMEKYGAIITWFSTPVIKGVSEYNTWLIHQIDKGKKIIILGDYGALYEKDTYKMTPFVKQVFSRLNLELPGEETYIRENLRILQNDLITSKHFVNVFSTFQPISLDYGRADRYCACLPFIKIINKEDSYFNFETTFKDDRINPVVFKSKDKDNRELISLYVADTGKSTCALIAPWGGLLGGDFFYELEESKEEAASIDNYNDLLKLHYDVKPTTTNNGKWVVNPFAFLNQSLHIETLPRLDYTTLNGQRIFYTHLDGDGLSNLSYIPTRYSGEVIKEEIFETYNLPMSVSIITGEMEKHNKKYYNYPVTIARSIFALDNVEIATHTHTHPFNMGGDLLVDVINKGHDKSYDVHFSKPDKHTEILYSTALINQYIAPPGKKVKTVFWPGMCNPGEEFIEEADRLGLQNLNGGDPIYDEEHKSYSNLCQIYVKRGERLQTRTSGSNDYIYTDSWTRNYGEMKKLIDHINHTDKPVRIYPINVYYHFYSGMYTEGVDAIKAIYDYCLQNHIAPLFASQYCLIVKDFYCSETGRTDDGGYVIHNTGYLRTVRFDNTDLAPDMERSQNIIGFDYYNNSLYIFLDDSKTHKIYLSDRPQSKVYLKSASHYIDNWHASSDCVKSTVRGLGAGYMEIANLMPDRFYEIKLGDLHDTVKTDKKGLLKFRYELKKNADYELEVRKK